MLVANMELSKVAPTRLESDSNKKGLEMAKADISLVAGVAMVADY